MNYSEYYQTDCQLRRDLSPTALTEKAWLRRRRQVEEYLCAKLVSGEVLQIPVNPVDGWRALAGYRFCLVRLRDGGGSPTPTGVGGWVYQDLRRTYVFWGL